jgi:hypothetical protein
MNKDQQETVNKMLDAMELDTYGEKGLREIIRQSVVEIVKRSAPPTRDPLSDEEIVKLWANKSPANEFECVRLVEQAHGITGGEE